MVPFFLLLLGLWFVLLGSVGVSGRFLFFRCLQKGWGSKQEADIPFYSTIQKAFLCLACERRLSGLFQQSGAVERE